jgi:aqualysin 1
MLLASMAMTTLLAAGSALTQTEPTVDESADDYIVVLNDNVDNPSQIASGIEQRQDVEVGFIYSNALEGFSATIPDENLAAVLTNPHVDYIERDMTAYAEHQTLPWGIDRVDADKSSTKAGDGTGSIGNVNAYIIDTGIDASHPDLNVVNHINFRGDGENTDCNGHGTHVAGTVAAKDNDQDVVGVAPGVPLTGVKVLGCGAGGPVSGVIKGVDWVTANAKKPAIANMSLGAGGEKNQALDDALTNSANSGVFYSVVAGNRGQDACELSPARAGAGTNNGIMTVAGTNEANEEMPISNYGSCVDIWAPGARILSTQLGGGTTTMGGTSMAAPHAGGGAALYLSSHTASPSEVEAALKDAAVSPGTKSKDGRAILLENVGSFPPETAIDSGPASTTYVRTASFEFSSSEENSTFECSLDDGNFEPCTSPQGYPDLGHPDLVDGSHTFRVRAIGVAGNADPTPAARGFLIDATKPTVSCSAADAAWHEEDVSIPCTASDDGSGLADPSDASFSLSTTVAEGTETDNASTGSRTVVDAAGNSVTAGPVTGIKVDKKAPEITISTPKDNASYLLW